MGNFLTAVAVGAGVGAAIANGKRSEDQTSATIAPAIVHDNGLYIPLDPIPLADALLRDHVSTTYPVNVIRCADSAYDVVRVSRNALLFPVAMNVEKQRRIVSEAQRANTECVELMKRKLHRLR